MKEHKTFKPFDKVLVRDSNYAPWNIEFYSHFNNEANRHETMCHYCGDDSNIIPYEGNEHLVGTTDEPEEVVELEKGELIITFDSIGNFDFGCYGAIREFIGFELNKFKDNSAYWNYAIRFSDFNPNDMEETKKHILCVRNGKIVKYKG